MTWDPTIATTKCPYWIAHAVWSPCSRFIAAMPEDSDVLILDGATLEKVGCFEVIDHGQDVAFSPGGHLLTWISKQLPTPTITSWDFQTGVQVSDFFADDLRPAGEAFSITHSECRTMIGVLFIDVRTDDYQGNISTCDPITGIHDPTLCIYDILSHKPISHHSIKGLVETTIWTHGKCIQFSTLGPGTITIWEVGFTSKDPPREVKSLLTPNNFESGNFTFLPTLSRLAFFNGRVNVWDCEHSKLLLNSVDPSSATELTFSSDGHFLACGTDGPHIYLWKDSPTGYVLHQIFTSGATKQCSPILSPNGESIAVAEENIIELWHITNSTITPSSVPVPAPWYSKHFILEFSPYGSLAAVVRWAENTVTILSLKSGIPQLVIDTGMKVSGLGMTENTVVVVGDGKVVAWSLPVGDQVHSARANISDGDEITTYDYFPFPEWAEIPMASISPDFSCIVVFNHSRTSRTYIHIYDMFTGKHLARVTGQVDVLWFTPDGHEIWTSCWGPLNRWKIIKDNESNFQKLEHEVLRLKDDDDDAQDLGDVNQTEDLLSGCPWKSSCDYKVTKDGWILGPSGKRLLWLPQYWQLNKWHCMWHGQFLAFLHCTLPDAVILELPEK